MGKIIKVGKQVKEFCEGELITQYLRLLGLREILVIEQVFLIVK